MYVVYRMKININIKKSGCNKGHVQIIMINTNMLYGKLLKDTLGKI